MSKTAKNFKTFFVVNACSGHGQGRKVWDKLEKLIKKKFGVCDFEITNSQGHGIILTTEALRKGYEMIVAVGGDGTVNEVVNGFFDEGKAVVAKPVLGVISAGTGADYVKSIGQPKSTDEMIAFLSGRETRSVDIGHITFKTLDGLSQQRYFANIAGCGLPGELVDEISKMPRTFGGRVAYLLGLAKALRRHQNRYITIEIDDAEPIRKKALCAVVANGQYFGSGMHIAPDAIIDDGWLDFVLIGDVKVTELLRHLPQLYMGNIRNHPQVEVYRAKKVSIASEESVLLDCDGEQPGVLPATYRILPKALRLKSF